MVAIKNSKHCFSITYIFTIRKEYHDCYYKTLKLAFCIGIILFELSGFTDILDDELIYDSVWENITSE